MIWSHCAFMWLMLFAAQTSGIDSLEDRIVRYKWHHCKAIQAYQAKDGHVGDGLREDGLQVREWVLLLQGLP